MMEVGKLYRCEYILTLYPDKETAEVMPYVHPKPPLPPWSNAAYWSKRSRKPVSYIEKNVPILVLNSEGKYIEVLAGDRKGWIISESWLHIKGIT